MIVIIVIIMESPIALGSALLACLSAAILKKMERAIFSYNYFSSSSSAAAAAAAGVANNNNNNNNNNIMAATAPGQAGPGGGDAAQAGDARPRRHGEILNYYNN